MDFDALLRGFSIRIGTNNHLQINPFQCKVNMEIKINAPNCDLFLSKYFISRAVLDSSIHFFITKPTNITAENIYSYHFDKSLVDQQNIQFYVHAWADINYKSYRNANLINFDLNNSKATFEFDGKTYIQSIYALNSSITFTSTISTNYEVGIVYSQFNKSTINSGYAFLVLHDNTLFKDSNFSVVLIINAMEAVHISKT